MFTLVAWKFGNKGVHDLLLCFALSKLAWSLEKFQANFKRKRLSKYAINFLMSLYKFLFSSLYKFYDWQKYINELVRFKSTDFCFWFLKLKQLLNCLIALMLFNISSSSKPYPKKQRQLLLLLERVTRIPAGSSKVSFLF